jgi:probable phosphoglycerate mutase
MGVEVARQDMIVLVRHGETAWNAEGRFQGRRDSPLTPRGIAQADQVGLRLAKELSGAWRAFEGHVSPLGRARQTATRIATLIPLAFRDEPRLTEVTFGTWDGMTPYEIDMEYPGALVGSDPHDWFFLSPDGETFEAACDRVRNWLSSLTSPTVAVTHGLTSRLIRGLYLGLDRREMLRLDVPQDGFVVLRDNRAQYVE